MKLADNQRRRLSGDEGQTCMQLLIDNWRRDGFDYKSIKSEQPSVVVCQKSFHENVSQDAFIAALEKRGISRLYVYQEWSPDGTSPVWEQSVNVFYPAYNGSECIALTQGCDFLLYASHENSLTVSGALAMECLDELWPDFQQRLWGWQYDTEEYKQFLKARAAGNAVKLWDAESGVLLSTVPTPTWVHCMRFSEGDNYVALGGMGRVWVADVPSGKMVFEGQLGDRRIDAVAISGDGMFVAAVYSDHIFVWNTKSGELSIKIRYAEQGMIFFSDMAFSPDGKYLAAADFSGAVRVFQLKPLKEACSVMHFGGARALSFSRDGKYFASGGNDGLARVTEIASEREIACIRHSSTVIGVSFCAGGRYVGSIGHSKDAQLWCLKTGVVLSQVSLDSECHHIGLNVADCNLSLVGRCMTKEGERYFVKRVSSNSGKVISELDIDHLCDANAERIVLSESGKLIATAGFNV